MTDREIQRGFAREFRQDFQRDFQQDFHGAKLALLIGPEMVVIRRDADPNIPWPGALDLPGGGREADETPQHCVLRETAEELGLTLRPRDLIWARCYERQGDFFWFFAARLAAGSETRIRFGDEGQGWCLMPPETYATHPEAVPHFRDRVRDFLAGEMAQGEAPKL